MNQNDIHELAQSLRSSQQFQKLMTQDEQKQQQYKQLQQQHQLKKWGNINDNQNKNENQRYIQNNQDEEIEEDIEAQDFQENFNIQDEMSIQQSINVQDSIDIEKFQSNQLQKQNKQKLRPISAAIPQSNLQQYNSNDGDNNSGFQYKFSQQTLGKMNINHQQQYPEHINYFLNKISKFDEQKMSQLVSLIENIEKGEQDISSLLNLNSLFQNKEESQINQKQNQKSQEDTQKMQKMQEKQNQSLQQHIKQEIIQDKNLKQQNLFQKKQSETQEKKQWGTFGKQQQENLTFNNLNQEFNKQQSSEYRDIEPEEIQYIQETEDEKENQIQNNNQSFNSQNQYQNSGLDQQQNNNYYFGEYGENEIKPETIKLPMGTMTINEQQFKNLNQIQQQQQYNSENNEYNQQDMDLIPVEIDQNIVENQHILILRVISTWGSISLVGLTQIKLYDKSGQQINLEPENLFLNHYESNQKKYDKQMAKLIDGVHNTTDEKHMWTFLMPDPPACLEIGIKVISKNGIGGLQIWNYNKSLTESLKGVKEIEILIDKNVVQEGIVKRGVGNDQEDYQSFFVFEQKLQQKINDSRIFLINQSMLYQSKISQEISPQKNIDNEYNSNENIQQVGQENININDNVQQQDQENEQENEDMPKSILKDLKVPMFLQAIPEQESEGGNSSTTNNSKKDEEKQQQIIQPKVIKSEIENSLQLQSVQNQNYELEKSQTQEAKLEKTYNISPKNSIVQIQKQQQMEIKFTSPQKIDKQKDEEENSYKNSQLQLQSQDKNYQEREQQIAQQQDGVNNSQYSQKISPVKNYSIQSYRDSRLLKKKNQQHQQQELQQTETNESQHSINLLQNESIKQSYIQNDNQIPQQEKSVLDQLKLQPGIPESILKKSMEYSKISNVSKRGSHPKVAWNFQEEVNQSKISIKDKKDEISNQSIKLKRSQLQNQSFKKTIQAQQQQQSRIFNQSQEIQKGVDVAKLKNEELEKKIREQEFKFQQQQQQDLEKKKKNQQEEERKRLEEEKKLNERIKKMEEQIQKDEKLKQDKLKKQQEEQKKAEQEKIQHQKFIDEQIKIDQLQNANLHKQNQNQNTNINKITYSNKGQEIFFQNSQIYKKNQNLNAQDKNQNQDESLDKNKNKKNDGNSQNLKNTFQSNLLEEILQSDQKQIQNSQSKLINSQKHETSQSQEPQFDASERGLDKLKLFDLTNQGRFQPAERTRFGQSKQDILEIQNEVQNTVRQVQKLEEEFNFSKINQNQQQNKLANDSKVSQIQLNQSNNSSIQNLNQSQKQQEIKATQNQNLQNKVPKNEEPDQYDDLEEFLKKELNYSNLYNDIFKDQTPIVSKKQPSQQNNQEDIRKSYYQQKMEKFQQEKNNNLQKSIKVSNNQNKYGQNCNENQQKSYVNNNNFENSISKMVNDIFSVDQNQSQLEKTLKIPQNPQGKIIELTIFSTWADKYYVGLNGIEFFDENGDLIKIANPKQQITANPPDINILPQYENDPRIVQNLVDGIYNTRDDLHVWLAPYNQENVNKIWIDFDKSVKLSAIRIWNYNKSRIHSFRGAKEIQIKFDEQIIFSGEIQKAPGQLNKIEKLFEFISFTNSIYVLENIENNDQINFNMDLYKKNSNQLENNSNQLERPNTGNNNNDNLNKNDHNTEEHDDNQLSNILKDQQGRPLTIVNLKQQLQFEKSLKNNENKLKGSQLMDISWNHKANNQIKKQNQQSKNTNLPKKKEIKQFVKCRKLTINILQSWGDQYYVGLNGIQFFDQNNQIIELSKYNIDAKPKDLNSIPGYSSDKRILPNLVNNQNISQKDENIWLIQYIPQENHYIYIDFHKDVYISGVKIYNYNKNKEDVIRGVKLLNIQVDNNQYLTPKEGILIRQAPGSDILDFGQYIELPYLKGWSKEQIETLYKPNMPPINNIVQEYDTLHMPQGMNIKISILSTYGDIFYVGLNGIEILDHQGNPVIQNKQIKFQIAAEPSSINIIPGHENDIRTIDKLVNGQNETQDDRNMWLTPLVSKKDQDQDDKKINAIFLYLEQPVIISAIKFWNYTKTPSRGVKEVEISLDDHIIYKGYIKKANKIEEQTLNSDKPYTTILFNKYPMLVQKIQPQVYTEDNQYQDVVMYNEKKLVSAPQSQNNNQQSQFNNFNTQTNRPSTKVKGLEYQQNPY